MPPRWLGGSSSWSLSGLGFGYIRMINSPGSNIGLRSVIKLVV